MPQQLMYVPRQQGFQNQMFNMLSQLMFQKMAFNQRMQVADKQIAAENLRIQEQRDYNKTILDQRKIDEEAQERRQREAQLFDKGFVESSSQHPADKNITPPDPITGEKYSRPGAHKVGELKPFKSGDKFVYGVYTGKPTDSFENLQGWSNTGITAPRQTPQTNINIVDRVEEYKQKKVAAETIEMQSKVMSPKFKHSVNTELQEELGADWDFIEPYIREEMLVEEMDRQIQTAFPDRQITFDELRGGWVDEKGKIIKRFRLSNIHREDGLR